MKPDQSSPHEKYNQKFADEIGPYKWSAQSIHNSANTPITIFNVKGNGSFILHVFFQAVSFYRIENSLIGQVIGSNITVSESSYQNRRKKDQYNPKQIFQPSFSSNMNIFHIFSIHIFLIFAKSKYTDCKSCCIYTYWIQHNLHILQTLSIQYSFLIFLYHPAFGCHF